MADTGGNYYNDTRLGEFAGTRTNEHLFFFVMKIRGGGYRRDPHVGSQRDAPTASHPYLDKDRIPHYDGEPSYFEAYVESLELR